ncbi:THUMP domain-containing protein 3 isoform X1 [Myxocyprinus asiaticus]|uniref:THUMP domain-containing protein 3 isoform X1 n=1 Tax=Myxocyprinus asiaticus TaxID=70543 RepID=UPI002223B30E|nr:THUMP domain-containing protein 3 isoform X1 [Myxocyprinus asiaticus]XP_051562638.1 THUMP domain-containing protein 3 isoform X1 [Myxocyprinus asiaticus]
MQELDQTVTIGATVPTGFELTAAEEVQEKLEATARVSKDRGRIYFNITTDKLQKVHRLKSVDNLFVVVQEYDNYQFKDTKEEVQLELQELANRLPWTNALEAWKVNNSIKKKKGHQKKTNSTKLDHCGSVDTKCTHTVPLDPESLWVDLDDLQVKENQRDVSHSENGPQEEKLPEIVGFGQESEAMPLKFRVTCSRAGDKHCFTSNDAARDFGGAIQELFHWKADMTKFDVEVLLNIHNNEVVIGIALTEESLHRRNITHFGPTTLRSTLAYGMLSFSLGLPIDIVQWDLCNLPMRSSSVDIIITDLPFGKRMGSKKKNWELYPLCLREMARVCKPGTGKAVLLTQDKKCFSKALLRMEGLWKKWHTVWVNVGGLHAGVFVLKRTAIVFGTTSKDMEPHKATISQEENIEDTGL